MNPPGDEVSSQDPAVARHGRQPAQAGRRRREIARRATSRRSSSRARRGSRTRSGRSLRSGLPTSNGSLENRLHTSRLTPDVVRLGRRARCRVRDREGGRACAGPATSASSSSGSTSTPGAWRNELRRPADTRRRPRCAPRQAPRAPPGRRARRGSAGRGRRRPRDSRAPRRAARSPVMVTPARPSSSGRSGPSPTKVSVPSPSRANASASRTTFLRSISEPTQTNAGLGPAPARAAGSARGRRRSRSPRSCRRASGTLRSSSRSQPLRDRDHRGGAPDDGAVGGRTNGIPRHVGDVLAVRGDDERRARRARGEQRREPVGKRKCA